MRNARTPNPDTGWVFSQTAKAGTGTLMLGIGARPTAAQLQRWQRLMSGSDSWCRYPKRDRGLLLPRGSTAAGKNVPACSALRERSDPGTDSPGLFSLLN